MATLWRWFADRCAPVCRDSVAGYCYYTDQCKDAVAGLRASSTYSRFKFHYKRNNEQCAVTTDCDSCTNSACDGSGVTPATTRSYHDDDDDDDWSFNYDTTAAAATRVADCALAGRNSSNLWASINNTWNQVVVDMRLLVGK